MSFHHQEGVIVESVDMPDVKPLECKVCTPKLKKMKEMRGVLKNAVIAVYRYFGAEFIYREITGLDTYEKAVGVELRLNGVEYSNAIHPILYKCQHIGDFKLPFVFSDRSSLVLELYKKEEQIDENKDYYRHYAKKFGIRKIYLGLIPEKEDQKVVFAEV